MKRDNKIRAKCIFSNSRNIRKSFTENKTHYKFYECYYCSLFTLNYNGVI